MKWIPRRGQGFVDGPDGERTWQGWARAIVGVPSPTGEVTVLAAFAGAERVLVPVPVLVPVQVQVLVQVLVLSLGEVANIDEIEQSSSE